MSRQEEEDKCCIDIMMKFLTLKYINGWYAPMFEDYVKGCFQNVQGIMNKEDVWKLWT